MKNKQRARRVLTVGFHLAVETKGRGHPSGKVASGRVAKTEKKTRIICSGGKAVDWETR